MIGEITLSFQSARGYYASDVPFQTLKAGTVEKFAKKMKEVITGYLMLGIDIYGNPLEPKKSISKHGSWKIFYDTGDLFKSIAYKMEGKNYAEVFVTANRSKILEHIQGYQGQAGTKRMPARNVFGVSDNMNNVLKKYLETINK